MERRRNGRVRRESESSGAKPEFLARLISELKLLPKEKPRQKMSLRRRGKLDPRTGRETGRRVSTTLRQVFAKFSEFFMCWGFPQKNVAPGSPGSDDLQLGRPTASPLLAFFKRISHFQSRSLRSAVPERVC